MAVAGLAGRFAAEGHELALVGGLVRDVFLGRRHGDLDLVRLGNTIRGGACGQSGSDVVLVGESAEDLFPADPVLGEVDRLSGG